MKEFTRCIVVCVAMVAAAACGTSGSGGGGTSGGSSSGTTDGGATDGGSSSGGSSSSGADAGGSSSSGAGDASSSSGGDAGGSSGAGGPCGSVTESGLCDGTVLKWCEDKKLEVIDCKKEWFAENQEGLCIEVSKDFGHTCVAKKGEQCLSINDEDEWEQEICNGAKAGCISEPDGDVCVENVGPCEEKDLATCKGDLAIWGCYGGQPAALDCKKFSGTCKVTGSGDDKYAECLDVPEGKVCDPDAGIVCKTGLKCVGATADDWGKCEKGGTTGDQVPPSSKDPLIKWLIAKTYKNWKAEKAIHKSTGPHDHAKAFVNDALHKSLTSKAKAHPVGAAAVKEIYASDKKTHKGWGVWVKLKKDPAEFYFFEVLSPDGKGTTYDNPSFCIDCHKKAKTDHFLSPWPLQ